jgi:hypothetical protein
MQGTVFDIPFLAVAAVIMGGLRYAILEREGPLHRLGDALVTPGIPSRAKAVSKCVTSMFKGAYYLSVVIWGYTLLTPTAYLPHELGGKGAGITAKAYEAYPLPGDGLLDNYYHVQLAFYIQDIAFQLQHYRRNDFTEMIIHHVCTIFLILWSFYFNCSQMGAVIMFLHDIADIPAATTKMFVDTPYVAATLISYVSLLISWSWTRLYVLPAFVIVSSWYECTAADYTVGVVASSGLTLLLGLHVYWVGGATVLFLCDVHWRFSALCARKSYDSVRNFTHKQISRSMHLHTPTNITVLSVYPHGLPVPRHRRDEGHTGGREH